MSTEKGAEREPRKEPRRFIDAFEFIRSGGGKSKDALEGAAPLARFTRLLEGLPEQAAGAQVRWEARADRGPLGEPLIRLGVATQLTLRCQRCMGLFAMPIESEVALHIVESEAELDDQDAVDMDDLDALLDEEFEKVLGSRNFDLYEQVEDELILSVPYVPKHDVCPEQSGTPAGQAAGQDEPAQSRPSPFAALAKLKDQGSSE